MTLEQALSKVTDAEAKVALQKIISDQNSYITKLETAAKQQPTQPAVSTSTQAYIDKAMRRDTTEAAKKTILLDTDPEVFNAVEQDWLTFLNTIKTEQFTEEYIISAFELVLGRCLRKKDHPVNKIGKGNSSVATPSEKEPAGSNETKVQEVQQVLQQPPVMNSNTPGNPGVPNTKTQVSNTRDAFSRFKSKFTGGNQFGN